MRPTAAGRFLCRLWPGLVGLGRRSLSGRWLGCCPRSGRRGSRQPRPCARSEVRPPVAALESVQSGPAPSGEGRRHRGEGRGALLIHRLGGSKAEREARIREALTRVELMPTELYVDRYPHELSGGPRQRVAIASALVLGPSLLVAGGPVSLLSVVPRRDPPDRTGGQVLRGETPDAVGIPSGGRFHPRCPVAFD